LNHLKRHAMKLSNSLLLAACSLVLLPLASAAHAADLPASVRDALRQAHIPIGSVGIVVREINSSTPLIDINAGQAMNPASTMKLLTTYAALELLGPAYTWRTEAYVNGKLENGMLDGDLIIKGYGNRK
jgi:D-alanyl-D-alanine carboxypeptidase/D-alanyl-D-alanine-endopeptidase (penicillin-binding protein 4)